MSMLSTLRTLGTMPDRTPLWALTTCATSLTATYPRLSRLSVSNERRRQDASPTSSHRSARFRPLRSRHVGLRRVRVGAVGERSQPRWKYSTMGAFASRPVRGVVPRRHGRCHGFLRQGTFGRGRDCDVSRRHPSQAPLPPRHRGSARAQGEVNCVRRKIARVPTTSFLIPQS